MAATWRGVFSSSSFISTFAPFTSRSSVADVWPCKEHYDGNEALDHPSHKSSNDKLTSLTARWSAVSPFLFPLISTPLTIHHRISLRSPVLAASKSRGRVRGEGPDNECENNKINIVSSIFLNAKGKGKGSLKYFSRKADKLHRKVTFRGVHNGLNCHSVDNILKWNHLKWGRYQNKKN